MAKYGASWTGIDISENQIQKARELSEGMDIEYLVSSVEDLDIPNQSFDVITACQCFWYFDHNKIAKKLYDLLKPGGHLVVMQMDWLPFEDKIAYASENLVLQYNPTWGGAGETRHKVKIDESYDPYFIRTYDEVYDIEVPFTRESWAGRIHACRGVGASLSPEEIECFNKEHKALLEQIAPESFTILHYGAYADLLRR
jgi:SAM-dependent methyltransferase